MKRFLALLVVVALATPLSASGPGVGTLAGQVVVSGEPAQPTAVWLSSPANPDHPLRTPVGPDGSFRLDSVPAGSVELAVETAKGLYVVDTPLTLAPGKTQNVKLALKGRDDTTPTGDKGGTADKNKKKKGTSIWNNPLTATLIVVGGAIVVGLIVDQVSNNDENPASPSGP